MFSEALRILDQNTMKYMIEELQKELQEKDAIIKRTEEEKDMIIKNAEERKNAESAAAKKELEERKRQLKEHTETTSDDL